MCSRRTSIPAPAAVSHALGRGGRHPRGCSRPARSAGARAAAAAASTKAASARAAHVAVRELSSAHSCLLGAASPVPGPASARSALHPPSGRSRAAGPGGRRSSRPLGTCARPPPLVPRPQLLRSCRNRPPPPATLASVRRSNFLGAHLAGAVRRCARGMAAAPRHELAPSGRGRRRARRDREVGPSRLLLQRPGVADSGRSGAGVVRLLARQALSRGERVVGAAAPADPHCPQSAPRGLLLGAATSRFTSSIFLGAPTGASARRRKRRDSPPC